MPTLFIVACKELNGGIYVTRLPKAVVNPDGSVQPGVPDNWYFIGPGTNPSVTEYSGTKFAVMFTYLSHLNVRIMDIATWPPTEVVPITSPPNITIGNNTTGSGAPQDSLTLKTEGDTSFGLVQQFFKPPLLAQPLLFLDPITNAYSVTITPLPGWAPDPPAGVQVFYRFYRRPFPYTGPWLLVTDWTASAGSFPWFSFLYSNVGSLQDQFSVTWGTQFNFTDQWNSNAHAEGIPGQVFVTVDSAVQHTNSQAFIFEHLTLDETSDTTFGIFGSRQMFIVVSSSNSFTPAGDSIGFSRSLVGSGTTFNFMGARAGFVQLVPGSNSIPANVPVPNGDSLSFSKAYQQGNTLPAVMG
jgi:hypothetical protein